MSIAHEFKSSELRKVRRWYQHARVWGYETDTGHARNYEDDLHGVPGVYLELTALSDLVFRNAVRCAVGPQTVHGGDVWKKGRQVDVRDAGTLCVRNGPAFSLLHDFFEDADPAFRDEIGRLEITDSMTPPFRVICHAAKALHAIAYGTCSSVRSHARAIQILVRNHEEDEEADRDGDGDSDGIL